MTSSGSNPHDEVLAALTDTAVEAGATVELGERIRIDRRSELQHLGLRTPARRRRVKQGFSFTTVSTAEVLAAWDGVWRDAAVADVMFAPLDYYRDRTVDDAAAFWATVSTWIDRIENWAHADDLARVYSRALHANPDVVYPPLFEWSTSDDVWRQRISMVGLIRYTGPNANFMPVDAVLDVVDNCVADQRADVAKAVGWVLRETRAADEAAVLAFLDTRRSQISAAARRRAMGGR